MPATKKKPAPKPAKRKLPSATMANFKAAEAQMRAHNKEAKRLLTSGPNLREIDGELAFHPLADLLPMMSLSEMDALQHDIVANKQREPIVLLGGKVLDGRNRYTICRYLGIPVKAIDYDPNWGAPEQYVYSKAVHRNLTDSQKACAACNFEEVFAVAAEQRRLANLGKRHSAKPANPKEPWPVGTALNYSNAPVTILDYPAPVHRRGQRRRAADPEVTIRFEDGRTQVLLVETLLAIATPLDASANPKEPWPPGKDLLLNGEPVTVWSYRDGMVKLTRPKGQGPAVTLALDDARLMLVDPAPTPARVDTNGNGRARDQAAGLFGVSGRYVQDALLLKREAPELFSQCFTGALPISRAKAEYQRTTRRKITADKHAALPAGIKGDWQLLTGDVLAKLEPIPARTFDLITTDPRYNLGFKYDGDATKDNSPPEEYLAWCKTWINECVRVLAKDGTLVILICEEWLGEFIVMVKKAGLHLRRLITWYETFGENCTANFNRTSRYLIYAVRDPDDCAFHADALQTPSWRAVNGDARAAGPTKNLDSVWQIPRIPGNANERITDEGVPTQLPLEMLTRIVCGFSDPGDKVLDCFVGTGTAGEACVRNGRAFTGIDQSKKYIQITDRRLRLAATDVAAPRK